MPNNSFTVLIVVPAFCAGVGVGAGAGWFAFGGDQEPCWQVQAAIGDAQDRMVRSFGQDARDDLRDAAAKAVQRPDCFAPRELDHLEQLARMPASPSPGTTDGEVTVEPTEVATSLPAQPDAQARMYSALADLDEQVLDDLAAGDVARDAAGRRSHLDVRARAVGNVFYVSDTE